MALVVGDAAVENLTGEMFGNMWQLSSQPPCLKLEEATNFTLVFSRMCSFTDCLLQNYLPFCQKWEL